ncbi:phosphoribosyltransferase family protein [Selenomonas sp. GACV-9]|uniref:ComF family protein n=1 Tax=Selenomonas sp. GACV-9 TaxID=3158782 RepID=UPI00094D47E7
MFQALWDFLFPARCPLCHKYVQNKGDWCEQCLRQACQPMRLPVSAPMQPILGNAWALSVYRGGTRELIRRLKYRQQRSALPYIRRLLSTAAKDEGIAALLAWCEIAVPVPLHVSRERQRGFNQAELIFGEWLQEHGVSMVRALQRVRSTQPMYQLTLEERRTNLKGAFAVCAAAAVADKRVLLIDDILTTGATLAACCQELERAGAAEIRVLVLASDHHF